MKRILLALALTLAALTFIPSASYASGSSVHGVHWGTHVHGRHNPWFGPRHNRRVHKQAFRGFVRHNFHNDLKRYYERGGMSSLESTYRAMRLLSPR
jgi:hypothetical protein